MPNILKWVLMNTFMGVQGAKPLEAVSFSTKHWLKPCYMYFGTILQNKCQILVGGGQTIFPPPLQILGGGAPSSYALYLAPTTGSFCTDINTQCLIKLMLTLRIMVSVEFELPKVWSCGTDLQILTDWSDCHLRRTLASS